MARSPLVKCANLFNAILVFGFQYETLLPAEPIPIIILTVFSRIW